MNFLCTSVIHYNTYFF